MARVNRDFHSEPQVNVGIGDGKGLEFVLGGGSADESEERNNPGGEDPQRRQEYKLLSHRTKRPFSLLFFLFLFHFVAERD